MIKEILLSEAVLGFLVALLTTVLYNVALKRLPNKALLIISDTFQFIEDNYERWGIFGSEKMARFVQEFIDKFQEEYGKPPTPNQIGVAVNIVEDMVANQKNSQSG